VANDGDREFLAEGLEAGETYRIALAEAGNVTIDDDGTVSFAIETGNADFGSPTAEIVETNGVARTAADALDATATADGEISFTIEADGSEIVVPVVFDADDDELPVNADGEPANAFGVGGETYFTDQGDWEVGVEFDPSDLRPFATDVEATFAITDTNVSVDGEAAGGLGDAFGGEVDEVVLHRFRADVSEGCAGAGGGEPVAEQAGVGGVGGGGAA